MAKKSHILIVLALVLALCVTALVGCSYKHPIVSGGDPTADTISNNGSVVKQGDYYYFVNGLETYETLATYENNKYGKPLKGSISRVKKNAEGVFEDFQVVVPKVILHKNKEQGFSIFGGHIYYVSPSITTDTEGVVQVTYTDFFRCKIDGSKVEKLGTINGDSMQYKFTDKGLIYIEDAKLKSIAYSDKTIGKPVVIEEEVTSSVFSVSTNYKVGQTSAQDFVFYAKAIDEENANSNEVYAVNGDASVKVKLMDKLSYTTDENDKANQYVITLKSAQVEDDGDVVIYYEKGGSYKQEGIFGYNLGSAAIADTLKFDKTLEKQFTNRTSTTTVYITFDTGIAIIDSTNGILSIPVINANGLEDTTLTKVWNFTKGVTLSVQKIVKTDTEMYMLNLTGTGRLEKIAMNSNGGFDGNSVPILATGLSTDWMGYEIIGDDIFFFNKTYMGYMFTAKMSEVDVNSETGLTSKLMSKMTEADEKTYKKQLEDEAEAEKSSQE